MSEGSAVDVKEFLNALEVVKQDLTCGVCKDLCKNPFTLIKCLHIICSEHFESLENCPVCKISLEGCKTIVDQQLETCIDSVRQLDSLFEPLKVTSLKQETINNKKISKQLSRHSKKRTITMEKELDTFNKVLPEVSISKSKEPNSNGISSYANNTLTLTFTSIKTNKELEKRNTKGETALHVACRIGNVDKIIDLIDKGANPNTKDNAGWTPLHEAVQNGRLDIVKLLLQHNTLIDVPGPSNETPLHEAVRYNHKDIIKELVLHGSNIDARNIKGETPLQLAGKDVKDIMEAAVENVLQTQGVNIKLIAKLYADIDFDDIRLHCVSKYRTVHNKVKLLNKHHDNLHIEYKLTKKVTHLIVDTEDDYVCDATAEILQAIVSGIWVLTSEWLNKCTENHLEPFENYEVKGVGTVANKGPRNSRYNKYKQLPGIFDGCHIYIHNLSNKYEISKTLVVTKPILAKLISDAGGKILRRTPNPESIPDSEKLVPYHAKTGGKLTKCSHYIIFKDIYEPMYNMQHLKALPIGWLIECFEKYELCEPW